MAQKHIFYFIPLKELIVPKNFLVKLSVNLQNMSVDSSMILSPLKTQLDILTIYKKHYTKKIFECNLQKPISNSLTCIMCYSILFGKT